MPQSGELPETWSLSFLTARCLALAAVEAEQRGCGSTSLENLFYFLLPNDMFFRYTYQWLSCSPRLLSFWVGVLPHFMSHFFSHYFILSIPCFIIYICLIFLFVSWPSVSVSRFSSAASSGFPGSLGPVVAMLSGTEPLTVQFPECLGNWGFNLGAWNQFIQWINMGNTCRLVYRKISWFAFCNIQGHVK